MRTLSRNESGKVVLALLGAISLLAAAAGVWSELYAQNATSVISVSKQVQARGFDTETGLFDVANLDQQPDGSFLVQASASGWDGQRQTFTDLEVGSQWQSTATVNGSISIIGRTTVVDRTIPATAQGRFEAPGTLTTLAPSELTTVGPTAFAWNVTPVTVEGSIRVQESSTALVPWNADYFESFNDHDLQLFASGGWNTSAGYVARVTKMGTQASTLSGGSLSLRVNGQPFTSATEGYGEMQNRTIHTVSRVDR